VSETWTAAKIKRHTAAPLSGLRFKLKIRSTRKKNVARRLYGFFTLTAVRILQQTNDDVYRYSGSLSLWYYVHIMFVQAEKGKFSRADCNIVYTYVGTTDGAECPNICAVDVHSCSYSVCYILTRHAYNSVRRWK